MDYLEMVKRYLRVTFDHSDEELRDLIEDGKAELKGAIYPGLEFNAIPDAPYDGRINALLKDYVRYAWNGSTQYFRQDYSRQILALSLEIGGDKLDP